MTPKLGQFTEEWILERAQQQYRVLTGFPTPRGRCQ